MKARVLGQVQVDRLYLIGEEIELSEQEAKALLALVPPPIEVIEIEEPIAPSTGEPESVEESTEDTPQPSKPKKR